MPQQTRTRETRFSDHYEEALALLTKMGLSPAQVGVLREYGLLAADNVTGFHEGRSGRGRFITLQKAIAHVKRTGEQAFYVEIDLRNLGGLNAALGHTGANEVYGKVAAIIRKELSAVASDAVFFRHGGDEMSAFLIDTGGGEVRAAMDAVAAGVSELATRSGLDAIPHLKHPCDPRWAGIGVHFGVCRLTPDYEKDPALVFGRADTDLERVRAAVLATEVNGNLLRGTPAGVV
jgi:GGDEF domain-containing protein